MTHVQEVTAHDLIRRREEVLRCLEMSYDQLAAKAASGSLTGDEWEVWDEIREIDFLLRE